MSQRYLSPASYGSRRGSGRAAGRALRWLL